MENFCVNNRISLHYGTLCTVDSVTSENSVVTDNPIVHKSFLDDIPEEDIKRKRRMYGKLPTLLKSVASVIEREL